MLHDDKLRIVIYISVLLIFFDNSSIYAQEKESIQVKTKNDVNTDATSQEMVEALHAIFVVRGKIDQLNAQHEKQMQQVQQLLEALQKQGKDLSTDFTKEVESLVARFEQDMQLHEAYLEEIKKLSLIASLQTKDALPSYYNDTMRQCEQVAESLQELEIVLVNQLASLCVSLNQLIDGLKLCIVEGFARNEHIMQEISNTIIVQLSEIAKIYADQILNAIAVVDEHVQNAQHVLFNEIGLASSYIITQVDAAQQNLDTQIVTQGNAILSQIGFVAQQQQELFLQIQAAVSNEVSLNSKQTSFLHEQMQAIEQSIENVQHALLSALTCDQAEQANFLKGQLTELQSALQSLINQTSQITDKEIAQCCKEMCANIHELHAQLDSQIQALASEAEIRSIEQTNKLASKLSAIDSHLYVATNYLLQKVNEVDDDVLNQFSLLQAQLACIEAEVNNEIIQKISDLSTEQLVNTNDIISQIAQTRTYLGNEIALQVSSAKLQLVEQNNELYSKVCEIDSSIAHNVSHGLLEVEKLIVEEGLSLSSQLEVMESEIINGLTTIVSDGFTDLTTQGDALCSKLTQAQADLNLIAGQIEDHECHMTEQHASICSKISAVEEKIVSEITNLNLHLSTTGYRIIQEMSYFASELAVIVRRATFALNAGIVYIIKMLTCEFLGLP